MKLQNGTERRGNPSWDVVGGVGFNLAYLEYMPELVLRGYDHFKPDSWILGKHCKLTCYMRIVASTVQPNVLSSSQGWQKGMWSALVEYLQ